jgi:hypothetical protein
VPRGAIVDARGPRSGRSEVESIDGTEYGATMSRVMADAPTRLQQHPPPNYTQNRSVVNCRTCFGFT